MDEIKENVNNNSLESIKKIYSDMIRVAKESENVVSIEYKQLLELENYYTNQARYLDVNFTEYNQNNDFQKSIEDFEKSMSEFEKSIEEAKENLKENENIDYYISEMKKIQTFQDNTTNLKSEIMSLKDILNNYRLQSENEIKQNVYRKVLEIIRNEEIQRYEQEKQKLCDTKIGFLGSILGKEDLRQEKIENLELLIQTKSLQMNEKCKNDNVEDYLVKLYCCAIKNREGNFSSEMAEIYNKIKTVYNFNNNSEFSDEKIYNIAIESIGEEHALIPLNETNNKTIKEEIEILSEENEQMKTQIFSKNPKNNFENFTNSNINYFGKFINTIQKISSIFTIRSLESKDQAIEYNIK